MINRKEWLTVAEVAEILNVSRQRVHYLCAMGELPFRWLFRLRLVSRAAVEARIASGRAHRHGQRLAEDDQNEAA